MRILRPDRRFWIGLLVGWMILAAMAGLTGAVIMFAGLYNTGADNPHLKPVAWVIHQTMLGSVRRRAGEAPALPALTPASVVSGARQYEAHCISCHGGPGVARAPWARALLPTPPFLIDARGRWTPAELHTLVAHGVKMSGMPAWEEVLPAKEIDDIVAFLEVLPTLTTAKYERLREQVRAMPTTPLEASGPAASIAPNAMDETQPLSRTVVPEPTVPPKTRP